MSIDPKKVSELDATTIAALKTILGIKPDSNLRVVAAGTNPDGYVCIVFNTIIDQATTINGGITMKKNGTPVVIDEGSSGYALDFTSVIQATYGDVITVSVDDTVKSYTGISCDPVTDFPVQNNAPEE